MKWRGLRQVEDIDGKRGRMREIENEGERPDKKERQRERERARLEERKRGKKELLRWEWSEPFITRHDKNQW